MGSLTPWALVMVIIEHNWLIAGPGGHYGLLQCQTGPGWLDAGTGFALGPVGFRIPLPIFAVVVIASGLIFLVLLFLNA